MLYIYANLFSEFQCQMCGTCCQNNWMVTVDQTCYQRNADLFRVTGRVDEFNEAFLAIESPSLGEYAMIAKQPQGQCWFLQPNNLCRLHKEAGHEHLDVVCKTFPRYPMNTARGIELTLSFSCPAVLKLVSESYLEIIRSEVRPVHIYSENFVTQAYPQQYSLDHPLHYYFELEQHFIDILQWRSLPMADRINRVCDTIDILCSNKPDDMGREITRLIYRNYEQLETADPCNPSQDAGSILVENFFVNTVFKKLLYDHGLKRGAAILQLFWRHIRQKSEQEIEEAARWEKIRRAIFEMEFEYSHHRRQFSNRK
ncbi:MAG: hypothetical protein K0Q77_1099 [Anaerosporomusa subterranea]|nr:hypothetical protein [Anaerosporomusa subterranea]